MEETAHSKSAVINADYEFELFKEEVGFTSPERILRNRHSTEFMFFFMNTVEGLSLFTRQTYSPEYLDYLRELGLAVPQLVSQGATFNWYGQLLDLPKEKRLNSKLWSFELLNKLALNPSENYVVRSRQEVAALLSQSPRTRWLLKSPYLMSGLSFHVIEDVAQVPAIHSPHILEPYFERVLDTALYYSPFTREQFFYVSKPTREGRYRGGLIFQSEQGLETYVEARRLAPVFEKLKAASLRILGVLQKDELQQPLTIDSFIFQDAQGYGFHPCCEINYRQNMGGLLASLRHFLPTEGVGEFLLVQNTPNLRREITYSSESRTGAIYLSPAESETLAIFFCGKNLRELERMQQAFFI